ncbi:PREDICTED: zinc finger protein 25-like isoform X1 [Bactrocera latifrons]|uniref:zinc finger protein 25-like isoform X1 n=1 Tax=Bactrocera latifrons TaxID=174628 RepID=UPI0008DE5FD1|nr:PREDICTED: zinc finger protein 25-like isoform X1 [Bactrocera latifrons]
MEIERNNAKIQCSDFKKCGEIATLLSIGKPDFFLNCGFCEYTFLQLDNFIRHMYEDHHNEFPGYELKEEPSEMEEIIMEEKYNTESEEIDDYNNTNDFILKGFEKVEIEMDMSEEHVPLDIGDNFTKEYWDEENLVENNLHGNEFEKGYNKVKLPYEKENTRNRQHTSHKKNILLEGEYNSEETTDDLKISEKIIQVERISKVNSRRNDNKRKNILKDNKIKSEESGNDSEISQEMENLSYFEENSHVLPKNTLEFNSNQLTGNSHKSDDSDVEQELEETQVSDSEHSEDKRNESLYEAQAKSKPAIMKITITTDVTLKDEHYKLLAEVYEANRCLWDEEDIAYRFRNRREEALKSVHKEFTEKSGLNLTLEDLESQIVRLRRSCSIEKRKKIHCKRDKLKFIPNCPYYQQIAYLEVDVPPFECKICDKLLSGLGQYKVHVASHDGSLPFKCHLCGHGFQLASNLTVHLRRHVHDYTYNCEVCNKPCATTTELKIHMRSHTGEKPFVCYICGQKARTSSQLLVHTLRHQNRPRHKCKLCPKTFYETGTLNEHMSIHRNIRDKICEICDKGFTSNKQLRQHQLIHNVEKKYACKFCEKRFAQYAGLSGHMKTHGTKLSASVPDNFL